MKSALVLVMLAATTAFATESPLTYKCDYRIVRADKPIFEISGNIIPSDDLTNDNHTTYLTLAPNELSGVGLEARILFTSDGYNPITLHKPGQSASVLASTTIVLGQGAELGFMDTTTNTSYSVICSPR